MATPLSDVPALVLCFLSGRAIPNLGYVGLTSKRACHRQRLKQDTEPRQCRVCGAGAGALECPPKAPGMGAGLGLGRVPGPLQRPAVGHGHGYPDGRARAHPVLSFEFNVNCQDALSLADSLQPPPSTSFGTSHSSSCQFCAYELCSQFFRIIVNVSVSCCSAWLKARWNFFLPFIIGLTAWSQG